MQFAVYGVTNKGNIRKINQDCFAFGNQISDINADYQELCQARNVYKICVCDGVGSCIDSDKAANLACSAIIQDKSQLPIKNQLINAINSAEKQVCTIKNSATTAVLLFSDGIYAQTANIGDSRAYLFRNNQLIQLTTDHTEKKLAEKLNLDKQLAEFFGLNSNALTQYLGITAEDIELEPTFSDTIELEEDYIFLLCSDGLTSVVSDKKIMEILKSEQIIEDKAQNLLNLALALGSKDNITVVLCEAYI